MVPAFPVTTKVILDRVQKEADARFGETIDHFLFLLEQRANGSFYINKWRQTGLLDTIGPTENRIEAAMLLETKARELVIEFQNLEVNTGDAWERYVAYSLKKCIQHLFPTAYDPVNFSPQPIEPKIKRSLVMGDDIGGF